jgi:hypothetical protein
MRTTTTTYKPTPEGEAILSAALGFVHSVPYNVTARWLFYRLLQTGVYSGKQDYKNRFLPLVTRARKAFHGGWTPATLADETREAIIGGDGYTDGRDWLERGVYSQGCTLDKWEAQPYYVELWFEAAAMRGQFEHYTQHVTLRPFQGDPSLDFKWNTAKWLEQAARVYGKPMVVLYFGDLDPKGLQIPYSARDDVQAWCSSPFEFIRCGLNPGDEHTYNLPENIDKPGSYQWEALADADASSLITSNLAPYIDAGRFAQVEARELVVNERFRREVTDILSRWTE